MVESTTAYRTLPQMFYANAERLSQHPLWLHKIEGRYQSVSWTAGAAWVRAAASALLAAGIQPGDRIAILSENRPEWAVADFSALSCGAMSVPIYATDTTPEIQFILQNSGAVALFLSSIAQMQKIDQIRRSLPQLRLTVMFDTPPPNHSEVVSYHTWLQEGRQQIDRQHSLLEERLCQLQPSDPATIIYTSGTTGTPKGVVLTHNNFLSNCAAAATVIPIQAGDVALSALPLSHVFERMAGHYLMLRQGATVAYAESLEQVAQNIREVRPTVMCAVPRLYEKMYAKILSAQQEGSHLKQLLAHWLIKIGHDAAQTLIHQQRPSKWLRLKITIARCMLGAKLKQQLGGRLRFFVSGGAPLSIDIAAFFEAMGVIILEGYGLTETSPVISVNTLTARKLGTVGRLLPNVEVRILKDGEIESKGPHIMPGYWQNAEATSEVLRDGWFSTGDIGHLDADGFLTITDRKKDLIITAGGKNIAPQKIENLLKSDPLINQIFVYGDRRPYLVALIVPNFQRLAEEAALGIDATSTEQLIRHPKTQQLMNARVQSLCQELPAYEQIKRCVLLDHEFTREQEEMTPTLKLRRKIVLEKHQHLIDKLYDQ